MSDSKEISIAANDAYWQYRLKQQLGVIDQLNETILHHAKEIERLEKENKKLKSWVYCQCKKPDYNKFGMDNMCARCTKPIENHPLSIDDSEKMET